MLIPMGFLPLIVLWHYYLKKITESFYIYEYYRVLSFSTRGSSFAIWFEGQRVDHKGVAFRIYTQKSIEPNYMMSLTTISINLSCTQCSRVHVLSTFYCVTCVYSFFNASLQLLGIANCRLNYLDLPMI